MDLPGLEHYIHPWKIPQMPQNISAQKFRIFEKKLSLGIRSPCLRTSDFDDYELWCEIWMMMKIRTELNYYWIYDHVVWKLLEKSLCLLESGPSGVGKV